MHKESTTISALLIRIVAWQSEAIQILHWLAETQLLQYAIAGCSMFDFPRTLLALPKALGHINYCRISFP